MRDRIRRFRQTIEEASAERTVPFAHGVGVFSDSLANVYDANYVRVDAPVDAELHAAEADALMEPFWHRRIATESGGATLTLGFERLGWTRATHVVMAHRRQPDRRADTGTVREVPLETLVDAHTRVTLAEPYGTPELAEQLLAAKRRIGAVARARYFAIEVEGVVAAYCELRSDGATAQIEDVNPLRAYRGRGFGRIVVQRALDEARATHDLVFLEALADDWPKALYAKLGFEIIAERHLFLHAPTPLARLRVRTPRLELRLATTAELRELELVAEAGIHDPAAMPFSIAWTDSLDQESFLGWHRSAERDWRPDSWRLELVAFSEGRPIGVQALHADDFASSRRASTGSWLGAPWQGHGLGTEMRAAILTLLFDGLNGVEAASGAIAGNLASLGVSRKLGYREIGRSAVSPRGTPVVHHDLRLRREEFRRPDAAVAIEGLAGLEPLFGARS
ncbi:MAG TPA: GNAT family N-acetyltransferase [Gaiellaceae bacterium]|nr:GNAT family N-acetyltransferase [Gaiellaceae bacterium]